MKSTTFTLAACISAVLAQSTTLTELIQSQPDLSTLGKALELVPDVAETLSGLKDITILAPNNAAFEALLAMDPNTENSAITQRNADAISALLAYHVLNGTYASTDFSEVPTYYNSIFTPAFTVDGAALTNVTLGQNVGLVLNGQNATILSGDLQTANVVEAVRNLCTTLSSRLTRPGHHGRPRNHRPQNRPGPNPPNQPLLDPLTTPASRPARRPRCSYRDQPRRDCRHYSGPDHLRPQR